MADRLYILAVVIGLALRDIIPWWVAVAAAAARRCSCGAWSRSCAPAATARCPVHFLGKAATVNLLYAFPLLLLGDGEGTVATLAEVFGWAFAIWGIGLYWWAGRALRLAGAQAAWRDRERRAPGARCRLTSETPPRERTLPDHVTLRCSTLDHRSTPSTRTTQHVADARGRPPASRPAERPRRQRRRASWSALVRAAGRDRRRADLAQRRGRRARAARAGRADQHAPRRGRATCSATLSGLRAENADARERARRARRRRAHRRAAARDALGVAHRLRARCDGPGRADHASTTRPTATATAEVLDTDLPTLVNGLWEAGAEAIVDQRPAADQAERDPPRRRARSTSTAGPLRPPYVVSAIGDPNTLPARFADTVRAWQWFDLVQQLRLRVSTAQRGLAAAARGDADACAALRRHASRTAQTRRWRAVIAASACWSGIVLGPAPRSPTCRSGWSPTCRSRWWPPSTPSSARCAPSSTASSTTRSSSSRSSATC